jgi:hypothetical protein
MSQKLAVPNEHLDVLRPALIRASSDFTGIPVPPVTAASLNEDGAEIVHGVLELADGSAYCGISFGAEKKSISGECVFQTGFVLEKFSFIVFSSSLLQAWLDTQSRSLILPTKVRYSFSPTL